MTTMVHKGCGGVIARSRDPAFIAVEGMPLRSADFQTPEGKDIRKNSPINCPKCKQQVSVHSLEFTDDQ